MVRRTIINLSSNAPIGYGEIAIKSKSQINLQAH